MQGDSWAKYLPLGQRLASGPASLSRTGHSITPKQHFLALFIISNPTFSAWSSRPCPWLPSLPPPTPFMDSFGYPLPYGCLQSPACQVGTTISETFLTTVSHIASPHTQVGGPYWIESQSSQGNFNIGLYLYWYVTAHEGKNAFLEKIGVHHISDVEVNPDVGKGLWQSEQLQ